jgi:hypothetical protein
VKGGGERGTQGVQFFAGLLAGFGVSGGDVNFCSICYETLRDHAANSFCSSCYENDFALLTISISIDLSIYYCILTLTLNKLVESILKVGLMIFEKGRASAFEVDAGIWGSVH